jgi:hypothetical protein
MYPRRFGWSPLHALRDGRFKLIDAPRPELYDLERDPFEERNIYDERRPVADAMTRRVRTLSDGRGGPRGAPAPVAADLQNRLAALGYVGSGSPARSQPQGRLPDPKDCIHLHTPRGDASPAPPFGGAAGCK